MNYTIPRPRKEVIWMLGMMALVVPPLHPPIPSSSKHLLPAKFTTSSFHVKGMARHTSKPSKKPAEAGCKLSSGWCHLLCGLNNNGYAEEIFWRRDHSDGIVATRSPDLTFPNFMEPGNYQERYCTLFKVY
jgi:hypothetical protein